jgi:hypothetical protein
LDERPHITVQVYGHEIRGLLDSGANCTILGKGAVEFINRLNIKTRPADTHVRTADGTTHVALQCSDLPFVFNGKCNIVKTLIIPSLSQKLILGINFWGIFGIKPTISGEPLDVNEVNTEPLPINLTKLQQSELKRVMKLFPSSTDDKIGCTKLLKHTIDTNGKLPPKQRFYPVAPAILKEMDKEIQRMEKLGVIEKSNSPSSNPLVVARKANGKIRLCLDCRKLNEMTVKDAYPLPLINDILGRLTGTRYLSSIDLKDAFWQIELDEEARIKTAFTVPSRGLYHFKRMPFGLCNAAQSLSRLMNMAIGSEMEPEVFVYLDDIVIASRTFEGHIDKLEKVAEKLKRAGLTISTEKSKFCVDSLKYLGYFIDTKGLHPDPDKISAIINYPVPKTCREVRRFLGMTGWYHRFITNYAGIACPLTDLLSKSGKFVWNEAAGAAFDKLRTCLVSAPILATPDFDQPFVIQCDASDRALGAVLTQGEGRNERVIAFLSKKFTAPQRKYAATEKECLAVLVAIKKFRQYVEGSKFTVITDCAALKWLQKFNDATNGRLCRWALQLQGYDFDIIHRKGKNNLVPDALSRAVVDAVEEDNVNDWPEKLREKIQGDNEKFWKIVDGKIYKRINDQNVGANQWKLAVAAKDRLRVIENSHDTPTSGHMGYLKTLKRIQENHYWPGMSGDVRQYVKSCDACKRSKTSNLGQRSLMGQQKPAERPWSVISVDFMGPLPRSKRGNVFLLVVTDSFTKYIATKALRTSTTKNLMSFLEDEVFLRFGVCETLISDNGSQFISKDFARMLKDYQVTHWKNAVYHPQNNPTERVNQVLGNCIRCFVGEDHREWDRDLSKITCAINTSYHEATKFSPFFLNFGRNIRLTGEKQPTLDVSDEETQANPSQRLQAIYTKVRENLKKAYTRNAKHYNLRARPITFKPGDIAWRRNFVQSDALKKFSAKLAPKKVKGTIVRRLGSNTYEFKDDGSDRVTAYSIDDLFPD